MALRTFVVTTAVLIVATAAVAQITGYSIDTSTASVTTFSCWELGDPDCFRYRTELGTIGSFYPAATTLSPTGELVVVSQPYGGDITATWYDLPSLDTVSSLVITGEVNGVADLAYAPDGTLWGLGWDYPAYGSSLFTLDSTTGAATEVWVLDAYGETMAFVGERLFLADFTKLLEVEIQTGEVREVADYYYWGPYPGPTFIMMSLSEFDGRLWSLGFSPPFQPGPHAMASLGWHDLETGDHEIVVWDFEWIAGIGDVWTLDLVDGPEQQPPAIPAVGRRGALALLLVIGVVGVFLVHRFRG